MNVTQLSALANSVLCTLVPIFTHTHVLTCTIMAILVSVFIIFCTQIRIQSSSLALVWRLIKRRQKILWFPTGLKCWSTTIDMPVTNFLTQIVRYSAHLRTSLLIILTMSSIACRRRSGLLLTLEKMESLQKSNGAVRDSTRGVLWFRMTSNLVLEKKCSISFKEVVIKLVLQMLMLVQINSLYSRDFGKNVLLRSCVQLSRRSHVTLVEMFY